ncbi:MAG: endoglycosylceramidase, partial [Solirubrobacterales bacterium]|nr:endoglycosylceramidase [Solirubrobacterales bacterium]
KVPPYDPAGGGFDAEDIDFLARKGFNTVRLGLIYKAIEPTPGSYNDRYLNHVAATQRALARRGIYSLLDFHQDLYNERFQGEGWPDWAVQDDGLPAQPRQGFPGNYLAEPALNRAFDHFWANDPAPDGVGLQDHYARAWSHVASRFRDQPGVLGYDLMNEPWPGSAYPSCTSPAGCPAFDQTQLTAFTVKVIDQIRKVDRRHLAWYEPLLTYDFGAQTWLADPQDGRAGFSFHDYCLPGAFGGPTGDACQSAEDLPFQNADTRSATTGDALMLSEFGATDDLATIGRIIGLADQHMTSWQYWHYCGCSDPTTQAPDNQAIVPNARRAPGGDNLRAKKLKLLARAYPRLVAGTPLRWSFDPATRRFELVYSTARVRGPGRFGGGISEIATPPVQYGRGYRVKVSGAEWRSKANAPILRLRSSRHAREVTVIVKPR